MKAHAKIYSWTASGLFLGSFLAIWVLASTPQPIADAMSYFALALGLVLALTSFTTFLGLEIRRARSRTEHLNDITHASLRQGIEFACLATGSLALWALGSASLWEIAFLAGAIIFAELAFSFKRREVRA